MPNGPDLPGARRTRRIASYYDEMQRFYSRCWHESGVHYGYWDATAGSHHAAVLAMNRLAGDILALEKGSRVLDAGCGVGGTARTLASEFAHDVIGLSVSSDQLRRAQKHTEDGAGCRPRYLCADYQRTPFADASFDGLYGIESICYADPLQAFFDEAARLLRPGGRVVVLDGFASAEAGSVDDAEGLRSFCAGFAIDRLHTIEDMHTGAEQAGFHAIEVRDITPFVMKSAHRIRHLARLGMTLVQTLGRFHRKHPVWHRHCTAGLVQLGILRSRAMRYCAFSATRR